MMLGVVTCNSSTWETEAKGWGVLSHLQSHGEILANPFKTGHDGTDFCSFILALSRAETGGFP